MVLIVQHPDLVPQTQVRVGPALSPHFPQVLNAAPANIPLSVVKTEAPITAITVTVHSIQLRGSAPIECTVTVIHLHSRSPTAPHSMTRKQVRHLPFDTPTGPTRRAAPEFEAEMSGKPTQPLLAHATTRRHLSDVSSYTFSAGEYRPVQSHQM